MRKEEVQRTARRQSEFFRFASMESSSPMKAFEMISFDAPVLAADLPSVRDILTPGVHAEFARAGDPGHWADKIEPLLGDPAYRDTLSRNARTLLDSYTYDARAARIHRIIFSTRIARDIS